MGEVGIDLRRFGPDDLLPLLMEDITFECILLLFHRKCVFFMPWIRYILSNKYLRVWIYQQILLFCFQFVYRISTNLEDIPKYSILEDKLLWKLNQKKATIVRSSNVSYIIYNNNNISIFILKIMRGAA